MDTPGFDDTNRSDTEVLKDIAGTLGNMYREQVQLSGIIYLHRITDNRLSGSALKNLSMFKKLCGPSFYSQVVLATTMWGKLQDREEGTKRESQLIEQRDWWGHMHKKGSKVFQYEDTPESALQIVDYLLSLGKHTTLAIQKELVDEGKDLQETSAGQEAERELLKARRKFADEKRRLEEEARLALQAKDTELHQVLREEAEKQNRLLEDTMRQQNELRVSFERMLKDNAAKHSRHIGELQRQQTLMQQSHQAEVKRARDEQERVNREAAAERQRHKEESEQRELQLQTERLSESRRHDQELGELREDMRAIQSQKMQEKEELLNSHIKALEDHNEATRDYYEQRDLERRRIAAANANNGQCICM
jgi:hypothetical protein